MGCRLKLRPIAVSVLVAILLLMGRELKLLAQERPSPAIDCQALNISKPKQFISFAGTTHKAWDGKRYVKGLVLRLTNNSNCALLVETPPGTAPRLIKKGGKYVWQNDWDNPELRNGSHVEVAYRIHFAGLNRSRKPVTSGDVILRSRINQGDSILFSVPLKFVKQRGEIELPFNYDSKPKTESVQFATSLIPTAALR